MQQVTCGHNKRSKQTRLCVCARALFFKILTGNNVNILFIGNWAPIDGEQETIRA